MIRLEIIKCADPQQEHLLLLKQYASVADDSRDALLKHLLVRSMKTVQEIADKSILPCTMSLTVSEREPGDGNVVKLYQSPDTIVSVKDGRGHDVTYERNGNVLILCSYAETVVVTYTTRPEPDQADSLLAVVLQYATALYDGADTQTLGQILTQC